MDPNPPVSVDSRLEEPTPRPMGKVNPTQNIKATKADDAEIPSHLWDERIWAYGPLGHLSREDFSFVVEKLRNLLHRVWVRRVRKDFWEWWRRNSSLRKISGRGPHRPSLEAGLAALNHAELSSWWDWDRGSSPFFWCFPGIGSRICGMA
ncbi:hypothetical protein ACA910_015871 [Epithemia clementina (nom. ined.)]